MKSILYFLVLLFSVFSCPDLIAHSNREELIEMLEIAGKLRSSSPHESVRMAESIIRDSEKQGFDSINIMGNIILGHVYTEWGQFDKAISHLNNAVKWEMRMDLKS